VVVEPAGSELAVGLLHSYFSELEHRIPGGLDEDASPAVRPDELSPPGGAFLVAQVDGRPAGCGGLRRLGPTTAEIKHMWIDPSARGRGVGRQLLTALEQAARALGYEVMRLDTSLHLNEALGLYRSSGYDEIPAYNDNPYAAHWFEKSLAPKTAR
jgi:GNAT superfamily N-acetyltransferase